MAYGVVHTTNVLGAKPMSFISKSTDLENGFFVTKGALAENERELFEALQPTTATLVERAYLVANPATGDAFNLRADAHNEDNFINKQGIAFRAYGLEADNKIRVTEYILDGDVEEGNLVTLANGSYKLVAAPVASVNVADFGFVGKIDLIDEMGYFYPIGQFGSSTNGDVPGEDTRVRMVTISVIKNGQ